MLDAATLLLSTIDAPPEPAVGLPSVRRLQGAARPMYCLGCHALLDLSDWFRFRLPQTPAEMSDAEMARAAGVEQNEFLAARQRVAAAGCHLRGMGQAWPAFASHRAVYAGALNALACHLETPTRSM